MSPLELIRARREHATRLANQSGAAGERATLAEMEHWLPRPAGAGLKVLLETLREEGITIKGSSFDAIHVAGVAALDFLDKLLVQRLLPAMTFIEIKTSSQPRVKPGFEGLFFALTEGEMIAAEALGGRHRVALFNKISGEILLTSVSEILSKAKSSNWQLSVQL